MTQSLGLAPRDKPQIIRRHGKRAPLSPTLHSSVPATTKKKTKSNYDRDLGTLLIRGFSGFNILTNEIGGSGAPFIISEDH